MVYFFSIKYAFDTHRQLFQKKKKSYAHHYIDDEIKSHLYINMSPSYMHKHLVVRISIYRGISWNIRVEDDFGIFCFQDGTLRNKRHTRKPRVKA